MYTAIARARSRETSVRRVRPSRVRRACTALMCARRSTTRLCTSRTSFCAPVSSVRALAMVCSAPWSEVTPPPVVCAAVSQVNGAGRRGAGSGTSGNREAGGRLRARGAGGGPRHRRRDRCPSHRCRRRRSRRARRSPRYDAMRTRCGSPLGRRRTTLSVSTAAEAALSPNRSGAGRFEAEQAQDLGPGNAPCRRAGTRHDQPPGPGAVGPERLEQLEHARVVGSPLPRERVRDVMLQMPVTNRNRVGVGRGEVGDVSRSPGTDAANAPQSLFEHSDTRARGSIDAIRIACEAPDRARTAIFDANPAPLPIREARQRLRASAAS